MSGNNSNLNSMNKTNPTIQQKKTCKKTTTKFIPNKMIKMTLNNLLISFTILLERPFSLWLKDSPKITHPKNANNLFTSLTIFLAIIKMKSNKKNSFSSLFYTKIVSTNFGHPLMTISPTKNSFWPLIKSDSNNSRKKYLTLFKSTSTSTKNKRPWTSTFRKLHKTKINPSTEQQT